MLNTRGFRNKNKQIFFFLNNKETSRNRERNQLFLEEQVETPTSLRREREKERRRNRRRMVKRMTEPGLLASSSIHDASSARIASGLRVGLSVVLYDHQPRPDEPGSTLPPPLRGGLAQRVRTPLPPLHGGRARVIHSVDLATQLAFSIITKQKQKNKKKREEIKASNQQVGKENTFRFDL